MILLIPPFHLITLLVLGCITVVQAATEVTIGDLLVENRVAPVGCDAQTPRFSWRLYGNNNGLRQTAYQIQVAAGIAEHLQANGKALIWDSGWVASDQSHLVTYSGEALRSTTAYFWRVRIKDETDAVSAWSPIARWVTGFMDAAKEFTADWIGYDTSHESLPHGEEWFAIREAQWICHPAQQKVRNQDNSVTYYRSVFQVPAGTTRVMIGMELNFTGQFFVNGIELFQGGRFTAVPSYLDVTPWTRPGTNSLAFRVHESQHQEHSGVIASIRMDQPGGKVVRCFTDGTWETTLKQVDLWAGGEKADDGWVPVRVLGRPGEPNKSDQGDATLFEPKFGSKVFMPPPVQLRREITLAKPVRFAVFHGTAQGLFDLRINGRTITPTGFQPGWTQFDKHLDYVSTDITSALQTGRNAIGVVLADGWFRGNVIWQGRENYFKVYGNTLRFSGHLEVEYEDGSREVFRSDPTWTAAYGATLQSDIYFGEIYDARLETGWDRADFPGATKWSTVAATPRSTVEVFMPRAHPTETVRQHLELPAKAITQPRPKIYVVDFGQNFAGWTRLKLTGHAGQVVYLRFGEELKPDGTIYTDNLRGANPADLYICKGGGEEVWEPRFTYHGFRYVQIVGLTAKPTPDTLTGIVAHSGGPITSTFDSASPILNRLYQNIQWSQRSNYFETMTDCPQRDERLGWTGDAHFFMPSSAYNQNGASFFTKWFLDCVDTQSSNGNISNAAPGWHPGPGSGPIDWSAAMMVTPWIIWQHYGDAQPIKNNYNALRRYMTRWESFADKVNDAKKSKDEAKKDKESYRLNGDWLAIEKTSRDFIGRVLGYRLSQYMADFARITNHDDDHRAFTRLAARFRAEIIQKHVAQDGTVEGDTQTAYASIFRYGLFESSQQGAIRDKFQKRMESSNYGVLTGFNGTGILLPALTTAGLLNEAGKTILNEKAPGWGNMVTLGATTIWEHWDSKKADGSFENPTMNSFNHYTLGGCGEWMMGWLVGLRPAAPGFKIVHVEPAVIPDLSYASGSFESPYGRLSNRWERKSDRITMRLTIPPNSSARVVLPATAKNVLFQGTVLTGSDAIGKREGMVIDSGTYEYSWKE